MPDLFDDLPPKPGNGYSAKDIEVLEGLEPVRRRPGMYVGGTDERALHHLAAEALDNAMDEAVAGHATRLELELSREGWVTVRDNGRGIPVDKHQRFPDKSALEVILTTLHSGGKFGGDAYKTSGGLHGVGVSVVNALSDALSVEVAWTGEAARDRRLYRQDYIRGVPKTALNDAGAAPNRRGTTLSFHPDPEIFGDAAFRPATLYRMARSKAYLFRGVEIRWSCDASLPRPDEIPAEARLHFPGGLGGSVEWAVAWPDDEDDGFCHSYCNTIPTVEGGTHEAGLRNALTRGLKAHSELIGNKRIAQATGEDVTTGAAMLLSLFLREPQFQGQTKERLASVEATRLVENAIRDHFDHWLSADPATTRLLLDRICERAEERLNRRQQKEMARKTATRKLRPSDPAAARQNPQRRQRLGRQDARQPGAFRPHPRARRRGWQSLQGGSAALRAGHHHDRRRCRRRAYRLVADDVLLPRDVEAGR
jgi:topoisomerase IV subunit B